MEHFEREINNNDNNNNNNNNNNDTNDNNSNGQQRPAAGVEDITDRLDRMNVDMELEMDLQDGFHHHHQQAHHQQAHNQQQQYMTSFSMPRQQGQQADDYTNYDADEDGYTYYDQTMGLDTDLLGSSILRQSGIDFSTEYRQQQQQQLERQQQNMSNILIVTNVDSSVFGDMLVKSKFESLFLAYDPRVTFRYLKSFRRVRLDFTSTQSAEFARSNLASFKLGNTEFKSYSAHIIRPNSNSQDPTGANSTHLNVPKLTKQFLISPPASPPVGWEPVTENSPCIDVQLISAIANLVPGKVHEIHAGNESQPGIYVEVCEDTQFEGDTSSAPRGCSRIPRTMSPVFSQVSTTTSM